MRCYEPVLTLEEQLCGFQVLRVVGTASSSQLRWPKAARIVDYSYNSAGLNLSSPFRCQVIKLIYANTCIKVDRDGRELSLLLLVLLRRVSTSMTRGYQRGISCASLVSHPDAVGATRGLSER